MRWHGTIVPLAVLALMPLFSASPAFCGDRTARLHIESGDSHLRLLFSWNEPVEVRYEVDGRALLLQFSRPLPPALPAEISARANAWIEWSNTGYDRLLLHAKRDVVFAVESEGDAHRVSVELLPARGATASAAVRGDRLSQQEKAALRLERLRAAWLADGGDLFSARRILDASLGQYPDNSELLVEIADIEARLGQWPKAASYYSQVLQLAGERQAVIAARSRLLSDHGSRFRLDMDWQQRHDADWQSISRLSGYGFLGEKTRLGVAYEKRSVRDGMFRHANGPPGFFEGERDYFELELQRYFEWAARARLSLFGGNGNPPGMRAGYSQRLNAGQRAWIDAAIGVPAWDYVEGVVNGGTLDSLTVGWERPGRSGRRLPEDGMLSSWISVSLRNYGIENDANVAGSQVIKLGARLLLSEASPRLSAGYQFDLEQRTFVDARRYAELEFHPLPIVSRQVHTLDALWFDRLSDYLRYEAGAGASYDVRNDAGGPFVIVNLVYEHRSGVEIGLKTIYSAEPYQGEYTRYTRAGGYLLWRF